MHGSLKCSLKCRLQKGVTTYFTKSNPNPIKLQKIKAYSQIFNFLFWIWFRFSQFWHGSFMGPEKWGSIHARELGNGTFSDNDRATKNLLKSYIFFWRPRLKKTAKNCKISYFSPPLGAYMRGEPLFWLFHSKSFVEAYNIWKRKKNWSRQFWDLKNTLFDSISII